MNSQPSRLNFGRLPPHEPQALAAALAVTPSRTPHLGHRTNRIPVTIMVQAITGNMNSARSQKPGANGQALFVIPRSMLSQSGKPRKSLPQACRIVMAANPTVRFHRGERVGRHSFRCHLPFTAPHESLNQGRRPKFCAISGYGGPGRVLPAN